LLESDDRKWCGGWNFGPWEAEVVSVRQIVEKFCKDLNKRAPRVMAVLRPLKLVIDNYPEGQTELLDAVNNPEDPAQGTRQVPFSKVLYIEQDDFRETPPKKYFRLAPGQEVRLRGDTWSAASAW
jgi:glutaminyl-tRNA synthetase